MPIGNLDYQKPPKFYLVLYKATHFTFYFEFYCQLKGEIHNMVAHQYFHKGGLLGLKYFPMDTLITKRDY